MANQKRPTASQLRYLLVMREAGAGGAVHSVDVARILGVKKPSVYSVMNAFSEAGWIRKGRYGAAVFTEEGRRLSDRYAAACRTIEAILLAHFPSLTDVGTVACTLLSTLSDEGIEALAKGQIQAHGEPSGEVQAHDEQKTSESLTGDPDIRSDPENQSEERDRVWQS